MQEGQGESSWWASRPADSWVGPHGDPDRYRVLEAASAGAEGRLMRGELNLDGNPIPVAIKILHDDQGDLPEWERRWTRQTEILRTVSHPSLVGVREVFVGAGPHPRGDTSGTENRLYLVMNWASGERLDLWAKGRPSAEIVPVLGALAGAIDYLHSGRGSNGVGVIHRDIKPANVIVSGGTPILVDFGFARFDQRTDETVVVYSRSFAAPEVIRGEAPDSSADRFAFAASALLVLTGLVPSRSSPPEMREALSNAAVPPALVDHLLASVDPAPSLRPADLAPWYSSAPDDAAPSVLPPVAPASPATPPGAVQPPATMMRAPAGFVTEPARMPDADPGTTSNIGNVMALLSLALVVVAAVAFGVWFLVAGRGDEIVIPDVVGLSVDEATDAFGDANVTIVPGEVESDAEVGSVVAVAPGAGTVVDPGTEVELAYASKSYAMPEITGLPVRKALEELTSRGAQERAIELRAEPVDDTSEWCTVASQLPGQGVRYNRNDRVVLQVAVAPSDDVEDCLPEDG